MNLKNNSCRKTKVDLVVGLWLEQINICVYDNLCEVRKIQNFSINNIIIIMVLWFLSYRFSTSTADHHIAT